MHVYTPALEATVFVVWLRAWHILGFLHLRRHISQMPLVLRLGNSSSTNSKGDHVPTTVRLLLIPVVFSSWTVLRYNSLCFIWSLSLYCGQIWTQKTHRSSMLAFGLNMLPLVGLKLLSNWLLPTRELIYVSNWTACCTAWSSFADKGQRDGTALCGPIWAHCCGQPAAGALVWPDH
jgi:hypothetical protein